MVASRRVSAKDVAQAGSLGELIDKHAMKAAATISSCSTCGRAAA